MTGVAVVGAPSPSASRAAGADPAAALTITGEASVEYKLDGARIQVHRDGDDVHVYTRSLAEITHRVPEVVEVVRTFPAERLILEALKLGVGGAVPSLQLEVLADGVVEAAHRPRTFANLGDARSRTYNRWHPGAIAQFGRAPGSHPGGRRFEPG